MSDIFVGHRCDQICCCRANVTSDNIARESLSSGTDSLTPDSLGSKGSIDISISRSYCAHGSQFYL